MNTVQESGLDTRPNEQYAYFSVVGDFDPVEISRMIGLQPTKCWKKGDTNTATHRERTASRWSLQSRMPHTESLEAHINDVLAQLSTHPGGVKEASQRFCGIMQLVGHFYRYYPGLSLDSNTIQGLAQFGLSLDCDFYYLYSASRENSE